VLSYVLVAALAAAPPAAEKEKDQDPLLQALTDELERSKKNLAGNKDAPLYYLSYRVNDGQWFVDTASFGAMEDDDVDDPLSGRSRYLDVQARVGTRKLDNTHKMRGEWSWDFAGYGAGASLPIEDEPRALKIGIWRATDKGYKSAVKQLVKVKTNKQVKVEEENKADDFSEEKPQSHLGKRWAGAFDRKEWKDRLKRLSAIFKQHPSVLRSSVSLQGGGWTLYFVDTEGRRIREPRFFARLMISGQVKAADGMDLDLYDDFEAQTPDALPTEEQMAAKIKELIAKLEALRVAPVVEPYAGPAIITNRAAAVFFHEIFGHRVEGHRQKDADEGHTFTKKVNQQIVPPFISVYDDPTREKFGEVVLNGHYLYDDEGVPAQKAVLVERGVLKGFLMGRSPIDGFPRSNGHGRAQAGLQPVARQGNLIVDSANQVPFEKLKQLLIEEVKKRGKPYGLVFREISGGFTNTRTGGQPQAFKVLPLVVSRIYPDGKEELVRGVDIVGTPLASFERITTTGDDFAVFNGFCGAESGYVPVSAAAPSLLIGDIEVEKKSKGHERSPLLPPPPLLPGPRQEAAR
jgi:TldD protein